MTIETLNMLMRSNRNKTYKLKDSTNENILLKNINKKKILKDIENKLKHSISSSQSDSAPSESVTEHTSLTISLKNPNNFHSQDDFSSSNTSTSSSPSLTSTSHSPTYSYPIDTLSTNSIDSIDKEIDSNKILDEFDFEYDADFIGEETYEVEEYANKNELIEGNKHIGKTKKMTLKAKKLNKEEKLRIKNEKLLKKHEKLKIKQEKLKLKHEKMLKKRLINGNINYGKWSDEEELFASNLINLFELGKLTDCKERTTLRSYLSYKLNCSPMRISKKFAGKCLGKQIYKHNYSLDGNEEPIQTPSFNVQEKMNNSTSLPLSLANPSEISTPLSLISSNTSTSSTVSTSTATSTSTTTISPSCSPFSQTTTTSTQSTNSNVIDQSNNPCLSTSLSLCNPDSLSSSPECYTDESNVFSSSILPDISLVNLDVDKEKEVILWKEVLNYYNKV